MFKDLLHFGKERSFLSAFSFLIATWIFVLVIQTLCAQLVIVTRNRVLFEFLSQGLPCFIILLLGFFILFQKKLLTNPGYVLVVLISGVVTFFLRDSSLGMIIVAFLTTTKNHKLHPLQQTVNPSLQGTASPAQAITVPSSEEIQKDWKTYLQVLGSAYVALCMYSAYITILYLLSSKSSTSLIGLSVIFIIYFFALPLSILTIFSLLIYNSKYKAINAFTGGRRILFSTAAIIIFSILILLGINVYHSLVGVY